MIQEADAKKKGMPCSRFGEIWKDVSSFLKLCHPFQRQSEQSKSRDEQRVLQVVLCCVLMSQANLQR